MVAWQDKISLDDLSIAENRSFEYPKILVRISCIPPVPKVEKIYHTQQASYFVEYYLKQTITLPDGDSGWPTNMYIHENTSGPYLMITLII